jgi:hypothetical protein
LVALVTAGTDALEVPEDPPDGVDVVDVVDEVAVVVGELFPQAASKKTDSRAEPRRSRRTAWHITTGRRVPRRGRGPEMLNHQLGVVEGCQGVSHGVVGHPSAAGEGGCAVQALSNDVGVPGMTGGLFNQVEENPSHRPGLDVLWEPGHSPGHRHGLAEVGDRRDHCRGLFCHVVVEAQHFGQRLVGL